MVYDYVILKDDPADKIHDSNYHDYKGKKLLVHGCDKMPDHKMVEGRMSETWGILLEIIGGSRYLTLQLMSEPGSVRLIHSRNIIIADAIKHNGGRYASLYELLWAAGVRINDETLLPVTAEKGETSIQGLFYQPVSKGADEKSFIVR